MNKIIRIIKKQITPLSLHENLEGLTRCICLYFILVYGTCRLWFRIGIPLRWDWR